ncbi:MAG: maltose acetyltransferase domain-containing protein [Ferruginibacter sp.]
MLAGGIYDASDITLVAIRTSARELKKEYNECSKDKISMSATM